MIIILTSFWERNLALFKCQLSCIPANYNTLRKDRLDGYGGILLVFQNTLNIAKCPFANMYNCEIIAATCTLTYEEQKIIICSTYRSPASDFTYL